MSSVHQIRGVPIREMWSPPWLGLNVFVVYGKGRGVRVPFVVSVWNPKGGWVYKLSKGFPPKVPSPPKGRLKVPCVSINVCFRWVRYLLCAVVCIQK